MQFVNLPNHSDERGVFSKIFNAEHDALKSFQVKQVNLVHTKKQGVLRGLHYQTGEFAEAKLFKVTCGQIQLAAFCVDKTSEKYLQSFHYRIDDKSSSVLVPRGFATGYLVLEENTEVLYCSDNIYNSQSERGVAWNDPILKIRWEIENPILSEKDSRWPPYVRE